MEKGSGGGRKRERESEGPGSQFSKKGIRRRRP